jgi:hypothetical protein
VKRIAILALFSFAVVDFILERGRIDLGLMTSTFMILIWRGFRFLRASHASLPNGGRAASKTSPAGVPPAH